MPVKVIGGKEFHARDFFYVGDPEEVGTWKLRKGENPNEVDAVHVSGAAQAIGPRGFRGQKAQIPSEDLPGVKRRILAAMRNLDYDEEHIKDTFSWLFGEGMKGQSQKFRGQTQHEGNKSDESDPKFFDPLRQVAFKEGVIEMEVFKAGDYGRKGNYTEADLQQIADDYDPKLHHAPVTIDHKQRGPAYGWVESVKRVKDKLVASISDMSEDLVKAIKDKRYGKRSIELVGLELYNKMRDTGRKYLRAVTILGAQVPEVKGLAAVELGDDGEWEGIDFEESSFAKATEDEKVMENESSVAPSRDVAMEDDHNMIGGEEDMEKVAVLEKEKEILERKFAESESEIEKLKKEKAEAELEKEKLAKEFSEEKARQKREQDLKDAKLWIEQKVEAGNITPAQSKAGLCDLLCFLEGLDEKSVIKFGEAEKRPADVLKDVFEKVKILDFKEIAPREPESQTEFAEFSKKARECGVSVREYQEVCKEVAKYPEEEGMTPEKWIEANRRFGEDKDDEE